MELNDDIINELLLAMDDHADLSKYLYINLKSKLDNNASNNKPFTSCFRQLPAPSGLAPNPLFSPSHDPVHIKIKGIDIFELQRNNGYEWGINEDWCFWTHGTDCRFRNIITGQIIEVNLLGRSDILDPYFFYTFIKTSEKYKYIAKYFEEKPFDQMSDLFMKLIEDGKMKKISGVEYKKIFILNDYLDKLKFNYRNIPLELAYGVINFLICFKKIKSYILNFNDKNENHYLQYLSYKQGLIMCLFYNKNNKSNANKNMVKIINILKLLGYKWKKRRKISDLKYKEYYKFKICSQINNKNYKVDYRNDYVYKYIHLNIGRSARELIYTTEYVLRNYFEFKSVNNIILSIE